MYKKFNEMMVKENFPEAVNHPEFFVIWQLGRKFERMRSKSKRIDNK
jgi:hypothetical protein